MPAIGGRSGLLCCLLWGLLAGGNAAAQDAAYFSPTFAASHGSPYTEIYATTFGASPDRAPPLETAAPQVAPPASAAAVVAPTVVYVIEDGRLLTYGAEDYVRGGEALAETALPASQAGGRLYGAIPPQPAAAGRPIPLLPQK